ncbi:MAG TPA: putative lipid II flippase FtsW [Gaiellales bacterium]|nr:putative lipid II flippase FtsW [Gaiellales bacterium]
MAVEAFPFEPVKTRSRRRSATVPVEYHLLLLLTLGLVAFGLIMVYSASSGTAVAQGLDPLGGLVKEAVYAVIGVVMMAVAARVSYRRWRMFAPLLILLTLGLLGAVLVPHVGVQVLGARRWIALGPLTVQPSELAKGSMALFAAAVLSARKRGPRTVLELLRPIGLMALLVCALVVLEPDLGTAVSIVIMTTGVLVVAGTPVRLLMGAFAMLATLAGAVVSQNAYMHQRLLVFLHPFQDAGGAGYQNAQALIALGSGGLFGKGLGNGTEKILYLPVAPSDMIGAVIGEELGLVGIALTALAFAGFALLGMRIALRCTDPFGKFLAAAVTSLICGQAFVNLGVVLGMLPLTGVPLPLISSGGSSLVVTLTLVGMLLNIAETGAARGRKGRTTNVSTTDADAAEATPKRPRRPTRADSRGGNRRARGAGAGGRRRAHG